MGMGLISVQLINDKPNIDYLLLNHKGNERIYRISPFLNPDPEISKSILIDFLDEIGHFPVYLYIEGFHDLIDKFQYNNFDYKIFYVNNYQKSENDYIYSPPIIRIKLANKEDLQKVISQTYNLAIANFPYILTFTEFLNFDLKKQDFSDQIIVPNFDFKASTSYIWIGYDGLFWDFVTNQPFYVDLNNFIKQIPKNFKIGEIITD